MRRTFAADFFHFVAGACEWKATREPVKVAAAWAGVRELVRGGGAMAARATHRLRLNRQISDRHVAPSM